VAEYTIAREDKARYGRGWSSQPMDEAEIYEYTYKTAEELEGSPLLG